MKKTIIVALSILLMLTAFTACNPTTDEDQTVSTAEWQYYNDDQDKSSEYVSVDSVAVAADGKYDLEISFADGKYAFTVDGQTLAKDIAPAKEGENKKIQGLYFGLNGGSDTAYSATFTAPVVTADGKTVDVPALDAAFWVNSRDGKAVIKVADDKKSVTITSTADAADYQGLELRADDLMDADAASWSVKTTVTVDTAIFETAGTGVGFWVETSDGTSDGFWQVIRLNSTAKAN